MSHSELAWKREIAACSPQTCDFAELAKLDLSSWRVALREEARRSLESWEAYVQTHKIALLIEQTSDEGFVLDDTEVQSRLAGCPPSIRARFQTYQLRAPERVREYLAHVYFWLVQIERERRTGNPSWLTEAASGSPEVLRELMFKWGPRFQRHRWTW